MRAFDPEVLDAIWAGIEPLIPERPDTHPYGGHRPRVPNRVCFDVMMLHLGSGMSWVDSCRVDGGRVSDTTVRSRRDEWIADGVFDALESEAIAGYDRIIGLDLTEVSVDGSLHKAPCGGTGTGKNPTDRAKLGHKWSIAVDKNGIVIGVALDGANRNDSVLFEPTMQGVVARGLHFDVETVHLDAGYDSASIRALLHTIGIDDAVIARRRRPGEPKPAKRPGLGLRWVVERTNSWLSNFGQMRRNTDRRPVHRRAQFALANVVLLTAKLIDWRDRWPATLPQTA